MCSNARASDRSFLLTSLADVFDVAHAQVGIFAASRFFLFLFLVFFPYFCASHGDFVAKVFRQVDTFAVKSVALSVLTGDRVLSWLIAFLQAASHGDSG